MSPPPASPTYSGWKKTPLPSSILPTTESIFVLPTNDPSLVVKATNPARSICVARFDEKLFAFAVGCECCKIPLTESKLLPPDDKETVNSTCKSTDPRLICAFCGACYNLRTGKPLPDAVGAEKTGNMLGGFTRNSMKAERKGMRVFELAEEKGMVLYKV